MSAGGYGRTPATGDAAGSTAAEAAARAAADATKLTFAAAPSGDATGATDTAALNSALAARGSVWLKAGTYVVNASLHALSGSVLWGHGRGKTILKSADGVAGFNLIQSGNATGYDGPGVVVPNIVIRDLTVDQNKANTTDPGANGAGCGIYHAPVALGATGLLVENVEVKNAWQPGIRCQGQNGSTDPATLALTEFIVRDCWVHDCNNIGIMAANITTLTVTGNTVQTVGADAIWFQMARNVTVDGNTTEDAGGYGIVGQYSSGVMITSNKVRRCANWGIGLGGGSVSNVWNKDFAVADNFVDSCYGGITIDPTLVASTTSLVSRGSITGNVVHTTTTNNGINVTHGDSITIALNTVNGAAIAGIAVLGSNCLIALNHCYGNPYGISLNAGGTDVTPGNHRVFFNYLHNNSIADYSSSNFNTGVVRISETGGTFSGEVGATDFAPTGLTGATQAGRFVGATASGAPASGTFAVGDYVIDRTGAFWICTAAGTPGAWVSPSGAAQAAAIAVSLQRASNLSDLASAPTARTNLGLGTAAVANKVAAGSAGVLDATDTSVQPADVQFFGASGTWNKPAGAKVVHVGCIGAGAGGGSGRRGAAGTVRTGGAGGGGGAITWRTFDAADVPSAVTVTVRAGGAGGPAVTADDTNGNAGAAGGAFLSTLFGALCSASPGGGGAGGSTTGAAGGPGVFGAAPANGSGAASNSAGGAGVGVAAGILGAGGGPSGGGISAANAASNGGPGTGSAFGAFTGGAAGVVDSTAPTAVASPPVKGSPGPSAGGGASSITTAAQAGAAPGTNYGAGGAGGGASLNGNNSGAGGAGGDGCVLVITQFR